MNVFLVVGSLRATKHQSDVDQKQTAKTTRVRVRRDFDALKARRMLAAEMFHRGKSQAEVAVAIGVSPQTTSVWHKA